jgi:hypothetical protein
MQISEIRVQLGREELTEMRDFWRSTTTMSMTDDELIDIGRRACYEVPDLLEQMDRVMDNMVEIQLVMQKMVNRFEDLSIPPSPAD